MSTLKDIVIAALTRATAEAKTASAQDVAAEVEGDDWLSGSMGLDSVMSDTTQDSDPVIPAPIQKISSREQVMDDAAYALELAKTLDSGAVLAVKLAEAVAKGSSRELQTFGGELINATAEVPKPVTNSVPAHLKGDQTAKTVNKVELSTNKEAADALMTSKLAAAESLMAAGQLAQAEALLREVEEAAHTKLAQDPSSPQPKAAPKGNPHLNTNEAVMDFIGDHKTLIDMTRAQARDRSTKSVAEFIDETPKKDNAVKAHVGRDDGLKTSGLDAFLQKHAARARG